MTACRPLTNNISPSLASSLKREVGRSMQAWPYVLIFAGKQLEERRAPDRQCLIFAGKQLGERKGECSGMTAWSPDPQCLIFAGKQLEERRSVQT